MRYILEQRLVELRQQLTLAQSQVLQMTANANAIGGAIQLAEQVLAAADAEAAAAAAVVATPEAAAAFAAVK